MKKHIVIVMVIVGLGWAGMNQAYAGWAGRAGNCPNFAGAGYTQQVDPEVQQKIDAFIDENKELQKSIVMKRAEYQALMRSSNPDPASMSKVAGELFDLRTVLQQKADAAGVGQYFGPMGGAGCGRGFSKGGRGMGGPLMGGQVQ